MGNDLAILWSYKSSVNIVKFGAVNHKMFHMVHIRNFFLRNVITSTMKISNDTSTSYYGNMSPVGWDINLVDDDVRSSLSFLWPLLLLYHCLLRCLRGKILVISITLLQSSLSLIPFRTKIPNIYSQEETSG